MFIKCECDKTEKKELTKQLRDEGLAYRVTTQTTLDETYDEKKMKTTTYYVVFHYKGKLV